MPNSLRGRLNGLASTFASDVLEVIRSVSLDQLLAESSGRAGRSAAGPQARAPAAAGGARRRGRLPRRSASDIEKVVEQIVSLLKRHPDGLRAEQIRDELGLEAKELPRPLKEALDSGAIDKSGQKRATTYVVKGSGGGKSKGRGAGRWGRGRRSSGGRKGRGPASGRATVKKIESAEAVPVEPPAQET